MAKHLQQVALSFHAVEDLSGSNDDDQNDGYSF
jgi:hypothetical protein